MLLGAVSGKGSSSGFIMWQPAGSPVVAIGSLEMVHASGCLVVVTSLGHTVPAEASVTRSLTQA